MNHHPPELFLSCVLPLEMLGNDAVTELAWATAPWGAQTLPQQRGAWTRITRMQEVKNLQTDRKKYYYKIESEKIQLKRVLK